MSEPLDLKTATPSEVEKRLVKYAIDQGNAEYYAWSFWRDEASVERVSGLGIARPVDSVGSGEGESEHIHVVVEVADGETTRFFKKNGYYSSYDGTYWDGTFYEVRPYTRTVTVYE